ncbi:hypothetical protein [Wenzhouxiangella sp. EGI_FJ10409]|uniref:hypothetical protein n=1 Tax=Wenzhouxiangella sp. EGI_FJ10409 TaxID=3243767 RepID=UPI0035D8C53F
MRTIVNIPILILTLLASAAALARDEVRDPTRPPTQAEIDAWFGTGASAGDRAPFQLQSILLAADRRIAIIDGRRLREGERIEDAEVSLIEAGRVILQRDGETIELNIDTHLTVNNDGSRN